MNPLEEVMAADLTSNASWSGVQQNNTEPGASLHKKTTTGCLKRSRFFLMRPKEVAFNAVRKTKFYAITAVLPERIVQDEEAK